jgi:hypothetical protein
MGQDVDTTVFSREDRQRYRQKVRRCLDVFARMLSESRFDFERPLTGLEIELNLVDGDCYDPAMKNAEVLERIADPAWQTELGQFNIEINVQPRRLAGEAALELEKDVRGQPQPRRRERAPDRHPRRHDRDPPDLDRQAPRHREPLDQPSLLRDQRADLRRPW